MTDPLIEKLERGYAAQQNGDPSLAEANYREVLIQDNNNLHALNLLGMLFVNSGRSEKAIEYISRALSLEPDEPQAHANIGLAYKDLGQSKKAIEHFRRSIALNPSNPVVHNNLGNVLRVQERPKVAIESYQDALKLNPQFAECWSNLAAALNESEQFDAGLRAVGRALQLEPCLAQAHNNLGDLLLSQAKFAAALDSYTKATELSPKYVAALINMSRVQRDMDSPDAALQTLRGVLEIEPNNPDAHHVMGVLFEQMGDREQAASSFKLAIASAPQMAVSHYYLAQLRGRQSSDEELNNMRRLWDSADLPSGQRMYLGFGLYRAYEQRGHTRAFDYLVEGNRIQAELGPYDDQQTATYLDGILSASRLASRQLAGGGGLADQRPVFIMGMPRSGTSLTEQIVASHSQVAGAGELSYGYDTIHRIREMTGEKFPENVAMLKARQFQLLGEYYLAQHSEANLAARYVVDKTPLNFQYVGVLALALPEAKFIHCHREPVANCFAIHRMPFDQKQTYAHDQQALGTYYQRYWHLMQQWHALFPGRVLDICYEDTVNDVERQSRRLLDFLNLDFEPAVLEFYNTRRLVKTPSASQVRQPIYKDSVQAWKRYEDQLEVLIAALQAKVDVKV
nr:uncharacterized protein aq_1088-like [Nerophis lumbriciformis]